MVMCYFPTRMHTQEGFDGNVAPSEVQIIMDQLPKSRLGLGLMRFGPMRFGEASLVWRVETEKIYIYIYYIYIYTYIYIYIHAEQWQIIPMKFCIFWRALYVYMYIYNL